MKTESTQKTRRPFWAALLVSLAVALFAAAPPVEANSGAGGRILNTVEISYKDASATTYYANATTYVTINRVRLGLTASGRPTPGSKGTTALMPSPLTVNSGATASYIVALTALANGGDTYNLSAALGSPVGVSGQTITWETLRNDGSTVLTGASPATIALGASVIQANSANTISIPGGSNLVALLTENSAGFKTLVVNGVDYIVSAAIVGGTAPSNTNIGGSYWNTKVVGTSEALAVITLAANPSGANTVPAFGVNALVGQQVGEQILVRVNVTASASAPPTNGTVGFTITTSDGAAGNSTSTASITTTFTAISVQVQKGVRNCGASATFPVGSCGPTAYTANAAGNPGDILEYRVLVNNPGTLAANSVTATDAVPTYTKLISFTAAYGDGGTLGTGLATEKFATVNDGTTTATITMQSSDTENGSVGSGDAAALTELSAIHFFLGTGNTNALGGSIAAGSTYTILYRVKIN